MRVGLAGRIAHSFLDSKLTPVAIVASLALGALALWVTPREEEPQIKVPMVDVAVAWPGAHPAEVAARVVDPIERAMWGLAHVEHVYSVAREGGALVTVRFEVGQAEEPSLVKVYERLSALGAGTLPSGASPPAVELHSIDDVPFQALTLWSASQTADELRPLAQELARELLEFVRDEPPFGANDQAGAAFGEASEGCFLVSVGIGEEPVLRWNELGERLLDQLAKARHEMYARSDRPP